MADQLIEKSIRDWNDVLKGGSIDAFRDDLIALQKRDGNSQPGKATAAFNNDCAEIAKRLVKENKLPNVFFDGVVKVQQKVGNQTITKDEVLVVDLDASDLDKKKVVFGVIEQDKFGVLRVNDIDGGAAPKQNLFDHPDHPSLDIQPNNIKQTDSNPNCHFAATLTDLAKEDTQSLQKMVVDNKNGTYTVTLPGDSAHPITVAQPNRWELETFGNDSSGIWAAVIDKAVRQRNHTPFGTGGDPSADEHLLTGKPSKALLAITPCEFPSTWIDKAHTMMGNEPVCPDGNAGKDITSLVEKTSGESASVLPSDVPRLINEAISKHMLVVADRPGSQTSVVLATDTLGKQVRIESGHAYSVLSYDPNKQTFMLRNPWGQNRAPNGTDFVDDGGYIYVPANKMAEIFPIINVGETSKTKS